MDPNEALKGLRRSIKNARESGELEDNEAEYAALQGVFEYAEALDEWLSRGGFLPDAWNQPTYRGPSLGM